MRRRGLVGGRTGPYLEEILFGGVGNEGEARAMYIKKGDTVQVMTGDDKGKRGRVLEVLPRKNKVVVEGINRVYKHLRRSQKNPQGGRLSKEMPVAVSNVQLIDPQ